MTKRSSFIMLIATALVLAVPAFASATTGLTEGGVLVAVGTKMSETNVGNVVLTSTKTGNVTCKKVTVNSIVKTNTTAEVKVTGEGATASTASECSVPSGAEVTVPSITLTEAVSTGEVVSGSTKKTRFRLTITIKIGSLDCHYTMTIGEATYTAGGSEKTVSEQPVSVTPAACGTTAKLDGVFRMETTGTTTALAMD